MKLYPLPGGTWVGTEADWKAGMKALGLNPKEFENTKTREVPTGKKELMEFLTFFAVDVYRSGGKPVSTTPAVDVEALRALHNPGAVSEGAVDEQGTVAAPPAPPPGRVTSYADASVGLDNAFLEAPIGQQLTLAALALENARTALTKG